MTYADKLKHPRWQKKRLLILERDHFSCQTCFRDEVTLHVHHSFYLRGKDPWDYPDASLVTLCEECHRAEPGERKVNEAELSQTLKEFGWTSLDLYYLRQQIISGKLDKRIVWFLEMGRDIVLQDPQ
jgi:hypothetical protein